MIELIGGGARSGKSRAALARANGCRGQRYFVATATADDAEMAERIARHRRERGADWWLIEEPHRLAAVVERFEAADCAVIDCLTLWLTNWLCAPAATGWQAEKRRFLAALRQTPAHLILVTNEVGQGVVPTGRLSREFVDQSGWLHQEIAALCARVTMMQFGIAHVLKPST